MISYLITIVIIILLCLAKEGGRKSAVRRCKCRQASAGKPSPTINKPDSTLIYNVIKQAGFD